MAAKKTARKTAKKPAPKTGKATPKRTAKKRAAKKPPPKKRAVKKATRAARAKPKKSAAVDFSALPASAVQPGQRLLCLSCVFEVFTKQLNMAPRSAFVMMKKHEPAAAEIAGPTQRPYFEESEDGKCPYCQAAKRWHARVGWHRIEGSRASDAERKKLFAKLPKADGQFTVVEEKASRQNVVFHWLERLGQALDFSDSRWMKQAARVFLEKREPKTDWAEIFSQIGMVRRSHRLEEGHEVDAGRLFLCTDLWDEVLLFQYFLSRSHLSGGRTFEGRLTIRELMQRLRRRGFMKDHEIAGDEFDVLEQMLETLDPGTATVRLYYVVDRRDYLERLKALYAKKSG